jgi:ParB/RepB/Spo0J family partition protein
MPSSSRTRPKRLAADLLTETPPTREASSDDLARVAENAFTPVPRARMIPIERIAPSGDNPRKGFEHIDELAESIAASGVLQPLLVRRDADRPGYYRLIAGERRLQAAHRVQGFDSAEARARVETLPCVIRDESDQDAFADSLAENVARNDLTRAEIMDAYRRLRDEYSWGVRAIARRTGRSVGDVSELLNLSDDSRLAPIVRDEIIAPTTASEIRRLPAELREKAIEGVRTGAITKMADVQRLRREAETPKERVALRDRDRVTPPNNAVGANDVVEQQPVQVFNIEHLGKTAQEVREPDSEAVPARSILNTPSTPSAFEARSEGAPVEERRRALEEQVRVGTRRLVQAIGMIQNADVAVPDDIRDELEAAYRSLGDYLGVTV